MPSKCWIEHRFYHEPIYLIQIHADGFVLPGQADLWHTSEENSEFLFRCDIAENRAIAFIKSCPKGYLVILDRLDQSFR